jgi:hypothetical protein
MVVRGVVERRRLARRHGSDWPVSELRGDLGRGRRFHGQSLRQLRNHLLLLFISLWLERHHGHLGLRVAAHAAGTGEEVRVETEGVMLGTTVEARLGGWLVKRREQVVGRRDWQLSSRCPDLILLFIHVRVELAFLIHKVGVRREWFHIPPHIHRVSVRVQSGRSPQHVRVSKCAEASDARTRIHA